MSKKEFKDVIMAESAVVRGDVEMGAGCTVWHNATIRGDMAPIRIGKETNIQDNAVVHVDYGFPTDIGDGVTVGHSAIVHGCSVGDNSLIGMGAIILNGAKIGKNCIVGAGALVTQNKEFADGTLIVGSPAKAVRELTPEEIQHNRDNALAYIEEPYFVILHIESGSTGSVGLFAGAARSVPVFLCRNPSEVFPIRPLR